MSSEQIWVDGKGDRLGIYSNCHPVCTNAVKAVEALVQIAINDVFDAASTSFSDGRHSKRRRFRLLQSFHRLFSSCTSESPFRFPFIGDSIISSGVPTRRNMLEFLWSRLQSCVTLAVTVAHQGILVANPEVRLVRIPGQPETYHGGFCVAFKCHLIGRGPRPEVVVVKCPKHHQYQSDVTKVRKMFEKESRTWMKLNHQNILPLIGFTYDFDLTPCIITPWMSEGSLTDFIYRNHNQLRTGCRITILREIASGLRYLHHSGIIHGDLTGSNVLVDHHWRICISDFGLSFAFLDATESIPSHICAHRWAATELFVHPDLETLKPVPTTSCDIYSFGCVVLQVLSGQIPFSHISRATHVIILKYEGKNPLDERPIDLQVRHWDFLQSTWSKEPEKRPSSDQVLAFMEEELERSG